MVELKFRFRGSPRSMAFTDPKYLDTIFIPTETLDNTTHYFEELFHLSPEQAREAAKIYLEEIYDQNLAHEATHLALGRLAKEEGLPVFKIMEGWHTSIPREVEKERKNIALEKALSVARKIGEK